MDIVTIRPKFRPSRSIKVKKASQRVLKPNVLLIWFAGWPKLLPNSASGRSLFRRWFSSEAVMGKISQKRLDWNLPSC